MPKIFTRRHVGRLAAVCALGAFAITTVAAPAQAGSSHGKHGHGQAGPSAKQIQEVHLKRWTAAQPLPADIKAAGPQALVQWVEDARYRLRLPRGLPGMCYLTSYAALKTLAGQPTVPIVPLAGTKEEYEGFATAEGRTARLGHPLADDTTVAKIAARLRHEPVGTLYELRGWGDTGSHAMLAYRDRNTGQVFFSDPENSLTKDAAYMENFWGEMGYSHFSAWRFGTMPRR